MHLSTTLQASTLLLQIFIWPSLAAPSPSPVKEYRNQVTHHEGKYAPIHLSKGKVGDNQVLHALLNDPNVVEVHHVLNALDNPQAAHLNMEHYIDRHIANPKPIYVYKTPNHLQEVEHHEAVFDTHNEDGTSIQPKRELLDFERDLASKLRKDGKTWVHSTAPTSLWHLKHIAKVTKERNNQLSHINLSVGHNSQQYHKDPKQKLAEEGRYLTQVRSLIKADHPAAEVHFHNSRMSFPESQSTSINRDADEVVDIIHPTTLKQAKKDIFFGPTIEKTHEHLKEFQKQGAIHQDFTIPDPHPKVFKEAGISLKDAVGEMLTTKDKQGEELRRVEEGRNHFKKFLRAAPVAMKQSLSSGVLDKGQARGTQKRLDRIDTDHFRAKFQGENSYPVEMGDPIALAAHRQAYHNQGSLSGPKYKPIHFREVNNRWIASEAKEGEEVHGKGLLDADSNHAFEDHKHIIKNGKDIGYIAAHLPKVREA